MKINYQESGLVVKRFSILQENKWCYVCGTTKDIHIHEVFYGKNRQRSIEDGCCVYLCGKHHNLSNYGIHFDTAFDLQTKQLMQKRWCEYYKKDVDDFIERYGKNYL